MYLTVFQALDTCYDKPIVQGLNFEGVTGLKFFVWGSFQGSCEICVIIQEAPPHISKICVILVLL